MTNVKYKLILVANRNDSNGDYIITRVVSSTNVDINMTKFINTYENLGFNIISKITLKI